jgi:glutaredoxin 3
MLSRMANTLKVYTADYCPYCMRAKALLKERGIEFTEEKLSYDDDQAWDALTKRSGLKTVPQIFHGDKLIGGYTELRALDAQDQLASLKV